MNVFQIAGKSIRQRLLPSSLTGLSVALGVMLMVAVLVTYSVVGRAFEQRTIGYDLVIGKQGSEIQLVLSTVYRIGTPPAPIPYRFYQVIKHNPSMFYPGVPAPEVTIPIAMGDTTEKGGFPIVGTTREYFDHEYAPGRKLLLSDRGFRDSYDAIIGAEVARENQWAAGDVTASGPNGGPWIVRFGGAFSRTDVPQIEAVGPVKVSTITQGSRGESEVQQITATGSGKFTLRFQGQETGQLATRSLGTDIQQALGALEGVKAPSAFKMVHGGADSGGHVHDELFTVVSVLQRTGTANDRTVFVQLGGFYAIGGHETPPKEAVRREQEFFGADYERVLAATADLPDPESGARIPTQQKAVTAILVKYPEDRTSNAVMLAGAMKRGHLAQAVNPIVVMRQLMEQIVGNVAIALVVMTVLVIVVSGVGIFVSIYNSMSDRRREIAVMRALGAQRRTVFSIIMAESILLCFGGGLLGVLLGHGLVFLGAPILEAKTGLIVEPLAFHPAEFVLLPALLVLASLVGFIPAMTAYRTDVARALAE